MPPSIETVINFTKDIRSSPIMTPIMRNALYDKHTSSGCIATLQHLVAETRERCGAGKGRAGQSVRSFIMSDWI
jgi:hypothetical protein